MGLIRFRPWRSINDVFNSNYSADESQLATVRWQPRVDIKDEKDNYVIIADFSDADPKDIDIHMEKGILTISGEKNNK